MPDIPGCPNSADLDDLLPEESVSFFGQSLSHLGQGCVPLVPTRLLISAGRDMVVKMRGKQILKVITVELLYEDTVKYK